MAIICRACADTNETLTKKVFEERRNLDATKLKVMLGSPSVKPNQARSRWRLGDKSSVSTRRRARTLTALFSDISAFVRIFNRVHHQSIRYFRNNKTVIQEALKTSFKTPASINLLQLASLRKCQTNSNSLCRA